MGPDSCRRAPSYSNKTPSGWAWEAKTPTVPHDESRDGRSPELQLYLL